MQEIANVLRETPGGKFSARRLALLVFVIPLSAAYFWVSYSANDLKDIPKGPIAVVAILSGSAAFQRKSTTPTTP
jgi:hypothetical protein